LRTVPFTSVRRAIFAVVSALALLPVAVSADNTAPTAWDGVNPFRCTVQNAGLGTEVPEPDADPYCVEFDKTRQNVTDLGVVDFLSKEPARVAAAVDKCFYFQTDHWRGSFVQDDGSTKTYEFDGHYFFDKAKANGGAWVTNFNIAGQTFDPSSIPGIPPEVAADLGPGTGGVITHDDIPADPACVALADAHPDQIYAQTTPAGHTCVGAAGPVTRRRLGPAVLGRTDARVRAALGEPAGVRRGFLRYCADGGGTFLVGQANDRSGDLGRNPQARTVIVLSTSPALRRRARRRHVLRGRHWVAVSALRGKRLRTALRRAGVRR
jgi:hypothetical protein